MIPPPADFKTKNETFKNDTKAGIIYNLYILLGHMFGIVGL